MAQFYYKARTKEGISSEGLLEAASLELAVASLQRKNLLIISVRPVDEHAGIFGSLEKFFASVPLRDVVIFTRQLATLFGAKVPVVESFKILISETENQLFKKNLGEALDDIQSGMPISQSLARRQQIFSPFYIAMVRSGEESGKLEDIFGYLADYLERSYELARKARSALIYPAFVLVVFILVMMAMLFWVIPPLSAILEESGQDLPIYTKIVIGTSDLVRNFGIILLIFAAVMAATLTKYAKTENGKLYFSRMLISMPIFSGLYRKIYLSRISDNLHTLLSGGITVVRALEITAEVVGNEVYKRILMESVDAVRGGAMISDTFSRYADIPPIFSSMIRIGEETGKLDYILGSIAKFYKKDVDSFMDNLVSLIEPILILVLAGGVGILVAAVLLPIYNFAGSI